jgi:hypothetical protein
MKKIIINCFFFWIIAISTHKEKDTKVNKLDNKMFGSWKGSENDNQRKTLWNIDST